MDTQVQTAGTADSQDVEAISQIVLIPVWRIKPFADQPRKFFDQAELKDLAESIRAVGQLTPVIVKEQQPSNGPEKFYELVDGQRRWHACDMLRIKVKATVILVTDSNEQFTLSVAANFGRVGHDHLETAHAIKRLQQHGKTVDEIAGICAHSQNWVYTYLKLLRLDPKVLGMMSRSISEEDRLLFSTALLLVDLPIELQERIANTVVGNRLTHAEARNVIRSTAQKLGIKIGDPNRTPNRDYNILRSLVKRLRRELNGLLSMTQVFFDRMFQSRSDKEHAEVVRTIEEAIEDLSSLLQAVRKTKSK